MDNTKYAYIALIAAGVLLVVTIVNAVGNPFTYLSQKMGLASVFEGANNYIGIGATNTGATTLMVKADPVRPQHSALFYRPLQNNSHHFIGVGEGSGFTAGNTAVFGMNLLSASNPNNFAFLGFVGDQIVEQGQGLIIKKGGNVGIGTINPSVALDVNGTIKGNEICIGGECKTSWTGTATSGGTTTQSSGSSFTLSGSDVSHGITSTGWVNSNVFFRIKQWSTSDGGAQVQAFSDSGSQPLQLLGVFGGTNPPDASAAVTISGAKSDGNGNPTYLADAETIFSVSNHTIPKVMVLGDGRVGIGVTYPKAKLAINNSTTAGKVGAPGDGIYVYTNSLQSAIAA